MEENHKEFLQGNNEILFEKALVREEKLWYTIL